MPEYAPAPPSTVPLTARRRGVAGVTGEVEQRDALVLPGRFGCEPERVWLSVLIEQLDRVNIKLQCVNVS